MEKYLDRNSVLRLLQGIKTQIDKSKTSVLDTKGVANGIASLDAGGNVPLSQLGNLDTTFFEVVTELPTDIRNIKKHIYILNGNKDGENNKYAEYIYTGDLTGSGNFDATKWEKLGDFVPTFDLQEYVKKNGAVAKLKFYDPVLDNAWDGDDDQPSETAIRIEFADGSHQYLVVPTATAPINMPSSNSELSDSEKSKPFISPGSAGFMSPSDKGKLDNIDLNALTASINAANTAANNTNTAIQAAETATTGAEKVDATITDANVFEVTCRDGVKKSLDLASQADAATIKEELAGKFDKVSVVQESGDAEDKVMSQKAITDWINKGYQFRGIATPTTNPGTPDGHVFYIANGKGTYTNFGGIDVTEDEVVVLYYDTVWHKNATGIASNEKLSELSAEVSEVSVVINGKPQETLEWQSEGYIEITKSLAEGAIVNINVRPSAKYRCLMVECTEGDTFLYTGRNILFTPFAFLDAEYRLLPNYGVLGKKYKDEKITAPQRAAYVILQTLYAEWVELGSLPSQRLGEKGIAEESEKIKDAVLVTPNARTGDEAMQAFSNLGVNAMKLNNVFSYGNFADTSVWTARQNTLLTFANNVARFVIDGTKNSKMGISTSKASEIAINANSKVFFAICAKTNQDNTLFSVGINGTSFYRLKSTTPINKNSDWSWMVIEWHPTSSYSATMLNIECEKQGANMTSDAWCEIKNFIVGIYNETDAMTSDSFIKLLKYQEWFYGSVVIPNAERFIALDSQIRNDIVVSVGEDGDFQSITAAMAYLSQFYPMYKYGGIKAEIRILNGTTITDQVLVVGTDYSWMTITYEGYNPDGLTYDNVAESIANGTIIFGQTSGYNAVAVDASSWNSSGITHDTRGDVCLFRAEDGGRLPKIKCVFKLVTPAEYGVAGVCCNRGSSCVVATLCGFIGFNDGVIANNESSITIREGITMNCGRWGCHARHNGEVSARSVIATGCATNTKYSAESAALCADRIADLDGREAWVSCGNVFAVRNASRMNCNGTHVLGTADETAIIYATAVGVGNFTSLYTDAGVKIDHSQGAMLSVSEYTFRESYVFNDVTSNGIIYK